MTGLLDGSTRAKLNSASPTARPAGPFTGDVKPGTRGQIVTNLQDFLAKRHLLTIPRGQAKGLFDSRTMNALKQYQRSVGLPLTGKLDADTRASLNQSLTGQ